MDYTKVYLANTNNGTAIGCSQEEALIHAISEIIERDAISFFLLRTFVRKNPIPFHLIDWKSIPDYLVKIAHFIEDYTGYKLIIFEMPNECELLCFGATLNHKELMSPIKGYGASIESTYALERALLEVLEQFHIYKLPEGPFEDDKIALELLKDWPLLYKCAEFDLGSQINAGNFIETAFKDIKYPTDNIEEYLEILLNKMSNVGFQLYMATLYQCGPVKTIQIIIPEAEDFFMVLKGIVRAPGERGKSILMT
jgi:ribosomal protein S12 methylthiotransferase accessory factor